MRYDDQFVGGIILRGERGQVAAQIMIVAFDGNEDGGYGERCGPRLVEPFGYVCRAPFVRRAERAARGPARGR